MDEINDISIEQLLEQQALIASKIEAIRTAKKTEILDLVKKYVSQYNLEIKDVYPNWKPEVVYRDSEPDDEPHGTNSLKGTKAPAKYRDEETGVEWSGRGLMPTWMKKRIEEGKTKEDYLIDKPAVVSDAIKEQVADFIEAVKDPALDDVVVEPVYDEVPEYDTTTGKKMKK